MSHPRVRDGRALRIAFAVFACGLTASAFGAQDIASLGPKVGERAIEFSLPDQNGVTQTLKSVAGPKGTMLVFFRSADW